MLMLISRGTIEKDPEFTVTGHARDNWLLLLNMCRECACLMKPTINPINEVRHS
jgi:hypothetical protein